MKSKLSCEVRGVANTIYGGNGGDPCEHQPVDRTVAYDRPPVAQPLRTSRRMRVAPSEIRSGVSRENGLRRSAGAAQCSADAGASAWDAGNASSRNRDEAVVGAYAVDGLTGRREARRGASVARWVVRILLLGVVVFGVMTIYYLTEQTVDQTSSLSSSAQSLVEHGAYLVESGQSPSVKADPIKWAAERIMLVSYKLGDHGLGVRYQAHVVEFGLLGGIIAMNVLAWLSGWAHRRDANGRIHGWRTVFMFVLTVGISACASFADQYHKLSVPGRHFDKLDLVLDASGYLAAAIGVFIVWSIGSAVYRAVTGK